MFKHSVIKEKIKRGMRPECALETTKSEIIIQVKNINNTPEDKYDNEKFLLCRIFTHFVLKWES